MILNVVLLMCFLFVSIFIFSNLADKRNRIWIFEEFKDAITEQYVLQELNTIPHLQSNYYWTQVSEVTKPPPVGADPCVCPTPKGVPQRLNQWKYVVPTLGGHMGPPLQSGGYGTSET